MYAYPGPRPDTYLNLRTATEAPYRGITAYISGQPYLVIDKIGNEYVLEGEDGTILNLEQFEWAAATDVSRLVAASRLEGSAFEHGNIVADYLVGPLVHFDDEWGVRIGHSDILLPLDQLVEALEENRWLREGFDAVASNGEILWMVLNDGEILLENPETPARNHGELLAQAKGRQWVRQAMADPDKPIGIYGMIRGSQIVAGGVLKGDMSTAPGKAEDPFGSLGGALRFHKAVDAVYNVAQEQGIPVEPSYTVNRVVPGVGLKPQQRQLISSLQGEFINSVTGDDVQFHSVDHYAADEDIGAGEYWEIRGSDNQTYYLYDNGTIEDEIGNEVGSFYPYAKEAASSDYVMPPNGIHGRTHRAMKLAKLNATVTYPPGFVAEYPDGYVSNVPGSSPLNDTFAILDYEQEHPGEELTVRVDTDGDPQMVEMIFDELSGRENPLFESAPPEIQSIVEELRPEGPRLQQQGKTADVEVDTTGEELKAIKCPNCGSHTLRAFTPEGGEAQMKCLTCGKEFSRAVFKNPESKVALGPTYPQDPNAQAQIIGLMHQIAEAAQQNNQPLVQQLQQQLEQLLGGNPNMPMTSKLLHTLKQAMRGYHDESSAFDTFAQAVIQRLGLTRISEPVNNAIYNGLREMTKGDAPNRPSYMVPDSLILDAILSPFAAMKDRRWDKAVQQAAQQLSQIPEVSELVQQGQIPGQDLRPQWQDEYNQEYYNGVPEKRSMRPSDIPGAVDNLRSDVIKALGQSRITLEVNDAINALINPAMDELKLSTVPNKALQSQAYNALVNKIAVLYKQGIIGGEQTSDMNTSEWPDTLPWDENEQDYYRGASMQKHAPGKEHMKGVSPKRNRQYEHILESCRSEHPEWPEDRCKELAARTVNKTRSEHGETKGSSYIDRVKGLSVPLEKEAIWPFRDRSPMDSPRMRNIHEDYGRYFDAIAPKPEPESEMVCPNCGSTSIRPSEIYDQSIWQCDDCGYEGYDGNFTPERTSRTASDEGKWPPGTRVEIQHQKHKGLRGTIVDYKGKDDDFDEEKYHILLDNGEELDEVSESNFKRIKSAMVNNDNLPDSTSQHFLGSIEFQSDYPPKAPSGIKEPEQVHYPENKTPEDYDPAMNKDHYFENPDEDQPCLNCGGNASKKGDFGARSYFQCSTCGMEYSLPNVDAAQQWATDDPDDLFGQDGPSDVFSSADDTHADELRQDRLEDLLDVTGNKLEKGGWYIMHHNNYKVPDVVQILKLEGDKIEAAVESDREGKFPLSIEASQGYTFEPYRPIPHDDKKSSSNWKVARRTFSPSEQRALIEENMEGRARNFDKLNLDGTHYQAKAKLYESSGVMDEDFLWS